MEYRVSAYNIVHDKENILKVENACAKFLEM